MTNSASEIRQNLLALCDINKRAIDILKNAKRKTYIQISESTGVHRSNVSTVLNRAKRFGFVNKDNDGRWSKTDVIKGLDLKRLVSKSAKAKPQNEEKIENILQRNHRIPAASKGSRYAKQAVLMAGAYTWLYTVENVLRDLIRKVYKNDPDFWKTRVIDDIKKKVQDAKNSAKYYAAARADNLEYTHLGQLKQIITSKKNWADFLPYLKEKNKSSFIAVFDRALPSRNAIAHSIPLKSTDRRIVDVRFSDILSMLA